MFKILTLTLTFLSCSIAFATIETYQDVKEMSCYNSDSTSGIQANIDAATVEGQISLEDFNYTLSNIPLVENGLPEASEVGIILDFLGSGFNGYGGLVSSTDLNDEDNYTFGTLFVLIDRTLPEGASVTLENMNMVYVEAMTGRQAEVQADCTFKRN